MVPCQVVKNGQELNNMYLCDYYSDIRMHIWNKYETETPNYHVQ